MTTDTPQPVPQPTPAPVPAPTMWFDSYDAETKAWLDAKGHAKLDVNAATAAVIKAARASEALIGVPQDRVVKLPANLTDPNEMGVVYDRLGRPKTADGYELKSADGEGTEFGKMLAPHLHAAGLSKAQGEVVFKQVTDIVQQVVTKQEQETKILREQAVTALKAEWGTTYAHNVNVAEQAMRALGIEDAERAELLQDPKQVKRFQAIGSKITEPSFVPAGNKNIPAGFPTTPDGARQKLRELENDKGWIKKFMDNDVATRHEHETLCKIVAMAGR